MAAVPPCGKKKAKKRSKSSSTKALRGDAGKEQKHKASGAQNQARQSGKEGLKSKRKHRKKLSTTDSGVIEHTQLEEPSGLEGQEELVHSGTAHTESNVMQKMQPTTARKSARLEERRAEIERKRREKQQLEAQKRQEEEERRLLLERLNTEGMKVQETPPTSEVDVADLPRAHDHRSAPIQSSSQQDLSSKHAQQHEQVPVCRREEAKRSRSPCSRVRDVETRPSRPKVSDEKESSAYKRYYFFANCTDT